MSVKSGCSYKVVHLVEIGEQDLYLQKKEKKEYVACLKSSGFQSEKCRGFSKKYLECRMERNLMAKQDMSELGFGKEDERDPSEESNIKIDNQYSPSTEKKKIAA